MDAARVRPRLAPTLEWIVAFLFLLASVLVTLLIVRELRWAPRGIPASPQVPAAESAAPVPGGISVPSLLLGSVQLRVGDTLPAVTAALGPATRPHRESTAPGPLGARITRYYNQAGMRFILVFEPFEVNGVPRLASIYLE
jgi:hypothetical protein